MQNVSISNKALQVISTIKGATDKSVTGVSFVSIRNYTNQYGEVANYRLNVGARKELIASFLKPDENRSEGQKNAYTQIVKGVKVHNETGVLYIYGSKESKKVITEGNYPTRNSKAITIAKNELRKLLSTGKFTQFALEIGNEVRANGETLEL